MVRQSQQPTQSQDRANKGKVAMSVEVVGDDGFVSIKTRNENRGQKRSLQERREEDTFNRFEALDDLSQQEVNPGLTPLDQGALGGVQKELSRTLPRPCKWLEVNKWSWIKQ